MEIIIKGTVSKVLGLQSGMSKSGKPWEKADILVSAGSNPQYPKEILISNLKDAKQFAALKVGEKCEFKVDIESRLFNDRYYTNITCYAWQQSGKSSQKQPKSDSLADQFPPAPASMQTPDGELPL